jgi:hypothetical protein
LNVPFSIKAKAPLTLKLCVGLLALVFVFAFSPELMEPLLLKPCESISLGLAVGFLLHPFAISGLLHWLLTTLPIMASALVSERDLGATGVFALWSGATAIGALGYASLAETCTPFIGPACIAWAYAGAAFVTIQRRWRRSHALEKVLACVVVAAALSLFWFGAAEGIMAGGSLFFGSAVMLAFHLRRHRTKVASRAAEA